MLAVAPPVPPCVPEGRPVLVHNVESAVYSTERSYLACTGTRRPVRLGGRLPTPGIFRAVGMFRLAGHEVAFVATDQGSSGNLGNIVVRNLRTRRQVISTPAAERPASTFQDDAVTSLVMRRDGSVAWIAVTHVDGSRLARREVAAANPRRSRRRLDTGSGIAARSLRLHGRRLSWVHDGHRRRARL